MRNWSSLSSSYLSASERNWKVKEGASSCDSMHLMIATRTKIRLWGMDAIIEYVDGQRKG